MKKILIATALTAAVSSAAVAATQGTLGTTSSGTLNVSLTVAEQVRISNLTDIVLDSDATGNSTGTVYKASAGDMSGSSELCVYYNNSANVTLKIDSANDAGGVFNVETGGETVAYQVNLDTANNGTFDVTNLSEGSTHNITNAVTSADDNCSGGTANTQAIQAVVTDTGGRLGVANGTYTDTITIEAAPTI